MRHMGDVCFRSSKDSLPSTRLIKGQLWVIVSHNPLTKWLQHGSYCWVLIFTEAATHSQSNYHIASELLGGCFHTCRSVHLVRTEGKRATLMHFYCWSGSFSQYTRRYTDWFTVTRWLDSFCDCHPASSAHQSSWRNRGTYYEWWLTGRDWTKRRRLAQWCFGAYTDTVTAVLTAFDPLIKENTRADVHTC